MGSSAASPRTPDPDPHRRRPRGRQAPLLRPVVLAGGRDARDVASKDRRAGEESSSSSVSSDQSVRSDQSDQGPAAREVFLARFLRDVVHVRGGYALVQRFGCRAVLDALYVNDMLEENMWGRGAVRSRWVVSRRFSNPGGFLNWYLGRTARGVRR